MAQRRESVRVDADVSPFVRGMSTASAAASGFASNLDQADSRMANLVQSAMALTPAIVPIGAAAVPAVAGLVTQLGFAVGAAGTAVLAFQGVGDSLKALNEFQIAPTTENFAKLEEKLSTMSDAGKEFVFFLDDMRPKIQQLQNVAQEGLFPGLQEGIDELFELQPQFRAMISEFADTTGDLFAEAGENLNDTRWREFFDYVETNARPILEDMGRTFGNFFEGFAEMMMAFDPLTQDFSDGLLRMSRSFADWSAGLSGSAGFVEFVDYIRDTGPQVRETLGAFADAIVSLLKAAAPVGSVVLPVLEALADATAAIADSAAGPAIIGIAAAMGALGRSMALLQAAGLRGEAGKAGFIGSAIGADKIRGYLPAIREVTSATDALRVAEAKRADLARKAVDSRSALVPESTKRGALGAYLAANREVEEANKRVAASEAEKRAAFRQSAGAIGRTAGVVGGLAIATSGAADGIGLTNTASMALIGTMLGPWGTALGAGAGLVMDFAAVNDDLESSMRQLQATAEDTYNFTGQREQITQTKAALQDYLSLVAGGATDSLGDGILTNPQEAFALLKESFTGAGQEAASAAAEIESANNRAEKSLRSLLTIASGTGSDKYQIMPVEQLQEEAAWVEAALARVGKSIEDFDFNDPKGVREMEQALVDYVQATDSVPAKSRAVGEALRELESQIAPTVTQAEALKNAMDSLFGPGLNAAAATDAWLQSLRDLKNELKEIPDLMANTQKASDNRGLLRGSVSSLQDSVAANAANGVGGDKLVQQLLRGRDAIIAQGRAAGISGKQVAAYMDTLGLTPKNLTTIIESSGVLNAQQKMKALISLYKLTPKEVKTLVKEAGADPSRAKVERLAKAYNMTPKQVRTLLEAIDRATSKINNVRGNLNSLDGDVARTQIISTHTTINETVYKVRGVDGGRFIQADGGILSQRNGNLVQAFADGGFAGQIGAQQSQVRPYGGPKGVLWGEEGSGPWEAFISGHPAKSERSKAIAADVVSRLGGVAQFADGGMWERMNSARSTPRAPAVNVSPNVTSTARIHPADIRALADEIGSRVEIGAATGIVENERRAAAGRRR